MNPVTEAILKRSSESRLEAPAPPAEVLERALACAARAPDHALLRPWRYLVIEGEGREHLGALFQSSGDPANLRQQEKLSAAPLRAPMILVAVASPVEHLKIPRHEQEYSAAAGAAYLVLALQAEGFGAIWRTGDVATADVVRAGLGLKEEESIIGFIYTGSVVSAKPAIPRPEVSSYVQRWPGSASTPEDV